MNCEMAQRIIALAALAPAQSRQAAARNHVYPGSPGNFDGLQTATAEQLDAEAMARFEAALFDPDPRFDQPSEARPEDASAFRGENPSLNLDPSAFGEAELPENEQRALDEHLSGCRECQAEMAATAAFYRALSLTSQPEPTPSLLARARLRLDETLDDKAHQSAVAHLLQQVSFSAGRLRASPGLASGLLLLGLVVGAYGGYRAGHARHNAEQNAILEQPQDRAPLIADVSSIVRDPDSEQVEVRYDRLEPDAITGSLDDPSIRRLLVLAMQNGATLSVRNHSIDLLADECRHGHACTRGPIPNALLSALRSDRNPQVRIEALDGLEPLIADDVQVRDAVVRALMADSSPEVRIEAIRLLAPVGVDSSVRQALHTVAIKDGDPLIRSASQQMLNGIPQLQ